jgi:hypothetical protein
MGRRENLMDFLIWITDWYDNVAFIIVPLLLTIFILGVSLGIAQLTEEKPLRSFLMIIVAGILFSLSFFGSDFGRELYINLSAELFSALFALIIVLLATNFESWTIPLVLASIIAAALLFFVPPDNVVSNMPLNLATGLLGAWLTAFMIRKEWAWEPKKHGERLSNEMRKAIKEREETKAAFGDYFMLIAGTDEEEIQQRIDFLGEHDMTVLQDNPAEFDKETETYYRLINMKIETVVKDRETLLLSNKDARVRIIGYSDTTKRVYKQLGEVLACNEQKRLEAPSENMLHIEFKTIAPQQLFSAHIEQQVFQLAREWRHGEDENLQNATEALLEWGKKMQFIKE